MIGLSGGGAFAFSLSHSVPDNKSAVRGSALISQLESHYGKFPRVSTKEPKRDFKVGDKIRVTLHRGRPFSRRG